MTVEPTPELSDIGPALVTPPRPRPLVPGVLNEYEDDPLVRVDVQHERVPLRRFWALASVFALLTALAGFWVLAGEQGIGTWDPGRLWETIADRDLNDSSFLTRRLAHVVMGVGIILLPLVLAVLGRAAAIRRMILGLFTLLLVMAVAAQIWLGSLLMFDTPTGKITRFNGGRTAQGTITLAPSALPDETVPDADAPATATTPTTASATAPAAASTKPAP